MVSEMLRRVKKNSVNLKSRGVSFIAKMSYLACKNKYEGREGVGYLIFLSSFHLPLLSLSLLAVQLMVISGSSPPHLRSADIMNYPDLNGQHSLAVHFTEGVSSGAKRSPIFIKS